jgi:hypothetical protein
MTKQWEQYEATIRALYSEHPLSVVRQMMIDNYGFNASVRAYRGRLDRWGIRKYNRRKRKGSVSSSDSNVDCSSESDAAPSPDISRSVPEAYSTATSTPTHFATSGHDLDLGQQPLPVSYAQTSLPSGYLPPQYQRG